MTLSDRQTMTLAFIAGYRATHEIRPSYRKVQDVVGLLPL